jgi:hypothetical protein
MKDELAIKIIEQLTRWADAQEALLEIARESRAERLNLAEQMKQRFKTGFMSEKEGA